MANTPLDFKTKPWLRQPAKAISTDPVITSLTPNSGRTSGGTSVVISGAHFSVTADGTKPTVLFGTIPATVVSVAADGSSITVTTPLTAVSGYVDVTVTNPDHLQSFISTGAFLYYAGSILEVTPAFALTSGGVAVTVRGVSLVSGSTFTFGGSPATSVTFIDDTQYVVTVPAHVAGWVDVVMTEGGGHTSTLRNAFQYTTLARGSDIRRFPGTIVSKNLGSSPWTASFCIDGRSNKPIAGEEVQITDPFDGGRVIYHGVIMQSELKYEGLIDQHVWSCQAGDFQYMLNKYRPFGTYTMVSASEIVRDLMGKYAPDFDLAFVQTKLALVNVTFDGSKTMSEALSIIARAIGGGRWYLNARALHFFNPPAPTSIVIPAGSTGTGADFTTPVLSLGANFGSTEQYTKAYYAVRVSFNYSNGTESRLGPTSNVIASDGAHFLTVTSLPVGLNPSAGITCVGRTIYYLQGTNDLALAVRVNDNVTTTVSFAPLTTINPSVGDNLVGDAVTNTQTGSTGGTEAQAYNFTPSFQPVPAYYNGTDLGMFVEMGGTPRFDYVNTQRSDLRNGFIVPIAPGDSVGIGARSYAYWVKFAVTLIYPDGSTTNLSEWAGNSNNPGGGYFLGNITSGTPTQPPTYTIFYQPAPIGAPLVNGKLPYQVNVWMMIVGTRDISQGGGTNDTIFPNPVGQMIGQCPYWDGNAADGTPKLGSTTLDSSTVLDQQPVDFGQQPPQVPGSSEQTYVWPNPDGPYLEDAAGPHDITDLDSDLLRESDSGSQPFSVTEDITQLRNRVKVYGAASITVADAVVGDNAVAIANPDVFPISGGKVVAANGVELSFFSVSSAIASTNTSPKLLLTKALSQAIPNGTIVQFYCMAQDKDAQAKRGKIELDSLGNKTDGVHEYVVNDASLNTTQAVYLRANAELSIYKDPILTVKYSTRDPLTRPGARINIDLSNPPCKGTFLIQSVEVDQIRDDGDTISPRYTVIATNVLYDLTNFLLMLTSGSELSGSGTSSPTGASQIGVVGAAVSQSGSSTFDSSNFKDITGYHNYSAVASTGTTFAAVFGGTQFGLTGNSTTTAVQDTAAYSWIRAASTGVGNANALTNNSVGQRAKFNPRCRIRIRIAGAVTSQRWWIGWKQSSAPIFANADTQTGTGPGWGLRYSTVAGDGGWQLWTSDNVTFSRGPVLSNAPLIQGAEFDIQIITIGNGTLFYAIINGVTSATMALPANLLLQDVVFAGFQYQVVASVPVSFDCKSAYLGHDL